MVAYAAVPIAMLLYSSYSYYRRILRMSNYMLSEDTSSVASALNTNTRLPIGIYPVWYAVE